MATRTVEEGFKEFLRKLTPSRTESEAATRHRQSIKACLEKNYNMLRFFRSGSFGNGTSIYRFSDVDYFASIPSQQLNNNSDYSLRKIRNTLAGRFPNTGVRVDCPAIIVPFGSDARESTEVVPADYIKKSSSGHRIYDIPDCANGWMRASPEAHNAYVRKVDKAMKGKLKPLIRFIKAWKYHRNVPISSFYIELRVTKYAEGEEFILYAHDIKCVLNLLLNCKLARMQDPLGISGYIAPCKTDNQYRDALSKLETAHTRASNALDAGNKEKIKDAFGWWDLLYDYEFPSYYY